MPPFRVVFMGTPAFAVPTLRALARTEIVTLVATNPDRPSGRGLTLTPSPVKAEAESLGIPVFQPERARRPEAVERFAAEAPDLIVVAAYGHILPKSILDIPRHGCINVHASLLPRYRGAAPINWAVARGEKVTGVTIMRMDEGMDTGAMLHARDLPVGDADSAETIYPRLADLGAEALLEALSMLRAGTLRAVPQDPSQATMAPILKKEHGRIDWSRPAAEIRDLARGMVPWPSAYTVHGGKTLKVLASTVVGLPSAVPSPPAPGGAPGEIVAAGKEGVTVACGEGALRLDLVQPEGGRAMPSAAWAAGRRLAPGERLG